jgi:hypothetical protein
MTITTMHSEEYRYILAELGLMPYRRAAEVLHISQRSVAG